MSSHWGENLHLTIFGQSHSVAVGMTLEGIPAGISIDIKRLQQFLRRRAPGQNAWSTTRKEDDVPQWLAGFRGNITCGTPITAIIENTNVRSGDYAPFADTPRPAHADYTAHVKYRGFEDAAGGGHFSGRLTAPLCIAGGICLQILEREGISVFACIRSVGKISDASVPVCVADKPFPVADDAVGDAMRNAIEQARADGDSLGGVIECHAENIPAGLGDPMFDGMENRIASIVFGIPAVKGIEFGSGFAGSTWFGSENNDPYTLENGQIRTKTNHCGGILGGITNGMPLVFRVAVKPTPSIAKAQQSVSLASMRETELRIGGRHDPCIVPRAVPCVEAAAALAVYDALLGRKKEMLS